MTLPTTEYPGLVARYPCARPWPSNAPPASAAWVIAAMLAAGVELPTVQPGHRTKGAPARLAASIAAALFCRTSSGEPSIKTAEGSRFPQTQARPPTLLKTSSRSFG